LPAEAALNAISLREVSPLGSRYATLIASGLLASFLLSLVPGRERWASAASLTFAGLAAWTFFPSLSNHFALAASALAIVTLLEIDRDSEARLGLNLLRWTTGVVLFWTGLQKLLYGSYFHGQYFGWLVANDERFARGLALLVDSEELARLSKLGPVSSEIGAYRVDSLPLLVLANGTMLFELAAPFLLWWRKTRRWAVAAVVVFIVGVEAVARELLFGILFLNLLALFPERVRPRRVAWASVAVLGLLVVARIAFPQWRFN
jgi:hypothetical protein